MKARTGLTDLLTPLAYALALIISSANLFVKYVGTASLYLYMAGVFVSLFLIWRFADQMVSKLSQKQALWLTAALLVALGIIFLVAHPLINAGLLGPASDRDEAINIATTRLLAGQYPYYEKTYLDNPITPLPGALLLSIPFVLLGNGAYQILFWLIVFVIVLRIFLLDARYILFMLLSLFVLAPKVGHELLIGGDIIGNALYILLGMLWLNEAFAKAATAPKVAASLFLGVALSSRANFLFLLPLIYAMLVQKGGWKAATTYLGLSSFTFALITIPFWLYDPASFSPLHHGATKISLFDTFLPYSSIMIPSAMALITLALASVQPDDYTIFFRNCAIVQAFPVVVGVLIPICKYGLLWTYGTRYGTMYLFFAASAFWLSLAHRSNLAPPFQVARDAQADDEGDARDRQG